MTWRVYVRWLVPLIIFAVLIGFLYVGLSLRPHELPSALIDKPVPRFSIPSLTPGGPAMDDRLLSSAGGPILVNVFASWCAPCRIEHAELMRLAAKGVPIYGINYKDRPAAGRAYLQQTGNPYRATGADLDGRVAMEWGVYGVPETFVIDGHGRIIFKHVGPLTRQAYNESIAALLKPGTL